MTPLSKNYEMTNLINEITIALNVYVLTPTEKKSKNT